jgi:hypothetical protein
VDILCEDVDAAWQLLGQWYIYSVQMPGQAAAEEQDQRAMHAHD